VFWPYHYVEEEETKPLLKTASKSDVGNVCTRRHAPARRLATRIDARHASHASSSPGLVDPTWIPDDPTHVPDPDKDDVIMTYSWRQHTQSACHASAQSANTSSSSQHACQHPAIRHVITVGPTCHIISRKPSWAEPSWAEPFGSRAEPLAASRGKWFCAAESTCNRIWDWIWAAHQARIVLIKS
jgi:hypothetical protein